MYLAEVKVGPDVQKTDVVDVTAAIAKWRNWPPSTISHHGQACCDIAREWILATDYSQLSAEGRLTGPRWLREKYTWGPSAWPIHWCEAVKRKTLDCGALAALSHEVFTARGVRSFPAQLIQQFSEEATHHWRETWVDESLTAHWIEESLVYHEGCAVLVQDNEIKLWDASTGWWIHPNQFGGYGALLGVRIFDAQADRLTSLTWGTQRIVPNEWQKVACGRAAGEPALCAAE